VPTRVNDELGILNYVAGKSGHRLKYVTAGVDARKEKPVNVILLYAPVGTNDGFRMQAASTWGRRALDGKVAIAKEILAASGYSQVIPTLPNQTKRLEPREFDDWNAEIEFEQESIRYQPTELTIDSKPMEVPPLVSKALNAQAQKIFEGLSGEKRKQVEKALENLYPKTQTERTVLKERNDEYQGNTDRPRSKQTAKPSPPVKAIGEQDGSSSDSGGSKHSTLSATQRRNARRRRADKNRKDLEKSPPETKEAKSPAKPDELGNARRGRSPTPGRKVRKSGGSQVDENNPPARTNGVRSQLGAPRPPSVRRGN